MADRYRLYDEETGWVGTLGAVHVVVNVVVSIGVWFVVRQWGNVWPLIGYLCIMPTWALTGGYGVRRGHQLRFFVSSLVAIVPGFVGRYYAGIDTTLLHWAGLYVLVSVSLAFVAVAEWQRRGTVPIVALVGPTWLIVAALVVATAALQGAVVQRLLRVDAGQVAGGVGGGYVAYSLLRAWRVLFAEGWVEARRRIGQQGNVGLAIIARVSALAVFGVEKTVGYLTQDMREILRFVRLWGRRYLLILVSLAVAKILYHAVGDRLTTYVASGDVFRIIASGFLAFPAIFVHICAAALMDNMQVPRSRQVRMAGNTEEPGALVFGRRVLRERMEDTIGLLSSALICVVVIPGLPVMILTRHFSKLWMVGMVCWGGMMMGGRVTKMLRRG